MPQSILTHMILSTTDHKITYRALWQKELGVLVHENELGFMINFTLGPNGFVTCFYWGTPNICSGPLYKSHCWIPGPRSKCVPRALTCLFLSKRGATPSHQQLSSHWNICTWNVSLKLQNLDHFHAPLFTNHVYFTPHDRPPLFRGHHLGWPL